jgi:hypothetical protein
LLPKSKHVYAVSSEAKLVMHIAQANSTEEFAGMSIVASIPLDHINTPDVLV